jgi:hypothetical protein
VQIAVAQPIRIDDTVIVENESGRVEEITFNYVVVRLWDWRRMIVPLSYFIEKPFQNCKRARSGPRGADRARRHSQACCDESRAAAIVAHSAASSPVAGGRRAWRYQ